MDGSDRKSNSPSPISNNHRPLIPKSVDENGKSYKENNKRSNKNHSGSRMISANSKSNLSRKKVLSETNESHDNQQKTPNLDSKCVQKETIFDPNSESGEIGGNSRPYDPSTNYLSPRPKFLRYSPKRHREIMLRKEKGENDSESQNSDLSLPQSEGGEVNESVDEFEEELEVEDERKPGCFGALQLLMLLIVLVLSTSYIVSMNSPTPSPVVQAVTDLRNKYQILQDQVYGYANQNLEYFGIRKNKKGFDMEIEESSIELTEAMVEDDDEGETREEEEDGEIAELDGGEIQDFNNSKAAEKVDGNVEEIVELDGEIQDCSNSEAAEEVVKNEEVSVISNSEMLDSTSVSVPDNIGEIQDLSNSEVAKDLIVREVSNFGNSEILEAAVVPEKILIENFTDSQNTSINRFTEHIKHESNLKAAVIGLSVVLSAVIASVLLVLKLSKSNNNGVVLPHFEARVPDMEEKPSESAANVFISKPFINSMSKTPTEHHKSEIFYRSLSNESRVAPIIELLGELEISEMSTSLRSCGIKNTRATETEITSKLPVSSNPDDAKTPDSPNFDGKNTMVKKGSARSNQLGRRNELTTGLRRSSRIQNRVTSP